MRRTLLLTAIGFILSSSSQPGYAQTPQALARIKPGSEIRASHGGSVVQGTLRRLSVRDIVVARRAAEHRIALEGLDTVWVAHRSAGRGAWIGALAGLGLGAIAGFIRAPGDSDTPSIAWAAVYGAGGALGGTLLGFAIGSEHRRWERTYPQ